jgi:hypothetical protein
MISLSACGVFKGGGLTETERESGREWLSKKNPLFVMLAVKLATGSTEHFSKTMLTESIALPYRYGVRVYDDESIQNYTDLFINNSHRSKRK